MHSDAGMKRMRVNLLKNNFRTFRLRGYNMKSATGINPRPLIVCRLHMRIAEILCNTREVYYCANDLHKKYELKSCNTVKQ